MELTRTRKVVITSAAALGAVLGAAGITAAATNPGSTPAPQQPAASQHTGDYTPLNEQGKPEPADHANEPQDTAETNDTDTKDTADTPDAPDQTPAASTPATPGQG